MLEIVISGGQNGADIAGVRWAKRNGFVTGGFMPKGFRTEDGPRPEYAEIYGMRETVSSGYPSRTRKNIMLADGTLIFGKVTEPGTRLTRDICIEHGKPMFYQPWPIGELHSDRFWEWIETDNIKILNVAGNRETVNEGIELAVELFLSRTL